MCGILETVLPKHPVLALFYFLMPVLGLVVILDGFVRFGARVLGRGASKVEWVRAMARTFNNHVILVGLGRVGLRVLEQLLHLGEQVVVLEKDPDNHNRAFAKKHGVPVRTGGGREEGILDDLNIREAKSIILVGRTSSPHPTRLFVVPPSGGNTPPRDCTTA